ncbi:MAG: GMC family oxidoreductase [Candidatus Sericytochromatia bacterium]|nr:GMC family oxidoreductase [Candidatus Sericytochromatia bacterium]
MADFDYDYIIIGSGFGGSVAALRLSQKGYRVAVLEAGKRFGDQDFARSNWQIHKFLWLPQVFCYGIQRLTLLKDVLILSGAGVGGGSLVYANTLYVPPPAFFKHPIVQKLGGSERLMPYYHLAQQMLGVTQNPRLWPIDELFRETAREFNAEDSFKATPAGVFFGPAGKTVADPYFAGEGPERTGCTHCGACMVGCRVGAKNTLVKNYLYLAEKLGATIIPESEVLDVEPLSADGEAGYRLRTRRTTGLGGWPRKSYTSQGVVFSAGVLGTLKLLLKLKSNGRLPRLSERLGKTVRTNSEAILGARSRDSNSDYSQGIAITSSIYPDAHSHIEPVRYPAGSDVMGLLATLLTDGGGNWPRQLRFAGNVLRQPLDFLRMLWPLGFAKHSVVVLFMQTLDNSLQVVQKRSWLRLGKKVLSSSPEGGSKAPSYIPLANDFTRRLAARMNAIPGSAINEVLLDVPTTAHILGGCGMGSSPEEGVIDLQNRVFGYQNMLVCDGSMIPANLGVNPSLSITALSEHAMAQVPLKAGAPMRWLKVDLAQQRTALLLPDGPLD